MIKARELSDPRSCLNKATLHELLFVLLERDQAAPNTIRYWVNERIRLGLNKYEDVQMQEAMRTADEMEKNWRKKIESSTNPPTQPIREGAKEGNSGGEQNV